MKTNKDKNHGGRLKEEYRGMWAEYLCRFLEGYRKKGVTVKRISIQNEPAAVQIWDSCVYSAGEENEWDGYRGDFDSKVFVISAAD